MVAESNKPLNLFYCYAREDKALCNELDVHLSGLKRQNHIITWSDREIRPGVAWKKEINANLKTSHLILLLVSPHFIASDYCYGIEMDYALQMHQAGKARVIPVIMRPVDWEDMPFSELKMLPTDAIPVASWANRDDAFLDIARNIRKTVKELRILLKTKEEWVEEGNGFIDFKKNEEAIACFNRAISFDENYVDAIVSRGVAYGKMGRYEEALADFNRAVELDKEDPGVLANRGETYRLMGRREEALVDFNRAIELDKEDPGVLAKRGEIYRLMGRHEEALVDFNRAIELDKEYSWAFASRGETYRVMGRCEEALVDFNQAIELDKEYSWAFTSRGETYRVMGRYEEALADFNRAIELDEKEALSFVGRGEIYREIKRYEEALADFNRAIELDEKDDWCKYERSLIYFLTQQLEFFENDLKTAMECARLVATKSPNIKARWAYVFNMALYHLCAGRQIEAQCMYEALILTCTSLYSLQEATRDILDLQKVQPENELIPVIHKQLQNRIDEIKHAESKKIVSDN